jgi:hypothetical protein
MEGFPIVPTTKSMWGCNDMGNLKVTNKTNKKTTQISNLSATKGFATIFLFSLFYFFLLFLQFFYVVKLAIIHKLM